MGLLMGGRGGLLPMFGAANNVTFLYREQFTADESAPLATPRTAAPGPGSFVLVQTDGQFSTSGGKLVFPAQTTAATGDQGIRSSATLTRTAGLAMSARISTNAVNKTFNVGFSTSSAVPSLTTNATQCMSAGSLSSRITANVANVQVPCGDFAINTEYDLCVVLLASGALYLIRGGAYLDWTLLYVDSSVSSATLYSFFGNYNAVGTLDNWVVAQLGAPLTDSANLLTDSEAGTVALSTTFSHEANFLLLFTVTTLPSAGEIIVAVRQQDASNRWEIRISDAGVLRLMQVTAGSATQRGTASNVVNGSNVFVSMLAGIAYVINMTTATYFTSNYFRYASATAYATQTTGVVADLATGGVISNLKTYPMNISGAAKTMLDQGFFLMYSWQNLQYESSID